jgi:hypothetical protein
MKTVSVRAVTRKVATVAIVVGVGYGRPNAGRDRVHPPDRVAVTVP